MRGLSRVGIATLVFGLVVSVTVPVEAAQGRMLGGKICVQGPREVETVVLGLRKQLENDRSAYEVVDKPSEADVLITVGSRAARGGSVATFEVKGGRTEQFGGDDFGWRVTEELGGDAIDALSNIERFGGDDFGIVARELGEWITANRSGIMGRE